MQGQTPMPARRKERINKSRLLILLEQRGRQPRRPVPVDHPSALAVITLPKEVAGARARTVVLYDETRILLFYVVGIPELPRGNVDDDRLLDRKILRRCLHPVDERTP